MGNWGDMDPRVPQDNPSDWYQTKPKAESGTDAAGTAPTGCLSPDDILMGPEHRMWLSWCEGLYGSGSPSPPFLQELWDKTENKPFGDPSFWWRHNWSCCFFNDHSCILTFYLVCTLDLSLNWLKKGHVAMVLTVKLNQVHNPWQNHGLCPTGQGIKSLIQSGDCEEDMVEKEIL